METLIQDIRFAARTLVRAPGLTAVAVLTLALGIGANSAVFSLVNTVLLRPLPFDQSERIAMIFESARGQDHGNVSAHEFIAWQKENHSFESMALQSFTGFTLTGRGEPVTVDAQSVTSGFFDVVRSRPVLGRTFRAGDDQPGAPKITILSHAVWRQRFGGDSSVIGKRAMLDDTAYEIIGVMPARGDMDAGLWVPMDIVAEGYRVGKHSNRVFGRLKPDATFASAERDLSVVAKHLEERIPDANKGHGVHVSSLYEEVVGDVRRPFYVAFGAAAFVLLIACANVAHLLLTRAASRQKELAVRTALGAARSRLVRQLVTEAILLSIVGGVFGLLVALWTTDLLSAVTAVHVPRLAELAVDWRVFAMTGGLCLVAGLLSGLIPAIRGSSPSLELWLGDGMRNSAGPGQRVARVLVASEIAIALTLLVGAGLTVRTFVKLMRIDPGFDATGVISAHLPLPGPNYVNPERQRAAVSELLARVSNAPGVKFAGATTTLPLGDCCNSIAIAMEGRAPAKPGEETEARMTITAGRYFEAMRIPLRRGRLFEASDARASVPLIRWYPQQPAPAHFDEPQAAPVAIINETMARLYWPNQDAVGKRFRILFSPWVTVIGVVADVHQATLTETPTPELFLSDTQEPIGAMTLVVRGETSDRAALAGLSATLREQIHAYDRALPVGAVSPMDRVVWNSIGRPRFNAAMLGISGAIALLLAVVGVYGVISYSVARRTKEIGIRRALGARTEDVMRLVLGQAFKPVLAGLLLGAVLSLALTRVLTNLLYGVAPDDPLTFVSVGLLLGGVAMIASYLPGRRASRIDPSEALRVD